MLSSPKDRSVGTAERGPRRNRQHTATFSHLRQSSISQEGAAVENFMSTNRVIVCGGVRRATDRMAQLYAPFVRPAIRHSWTCHRGDTKYPATHAGHAHLLHDRSPCLATPWAGCDLVRKGDRGGRRIGPGFLFPGRLRAIVLPQGREGADPHRRGPQACVHILQAVEAAKRRRRACFSRSRAHASETSARRAHGPPCGASPSRPKPTTYARAPALVWWEAAARGGARGGLHDPACPPPAALRPPEYRVDLTPRTATTPWTAQPTLARSSRWLEYRNPAFERIKRA